MKTSADRSTAAPPSVSPVSVSPAVALRAVARISKDSRLGSSAPQLRSPSSALSEGGLVNAAAVGRFKAGKSSFLDRLTGAEVLPADVLPATAVIARMSRGPVCDPDDFRRVAVVDVELTSLGPFRGIRFVDTPGSGSVYPEGGRISTDWLRGDRDRTGGPLLGSDVRGHRLAALSSRHPGGQDLRHIAGHGAFLVAAFIFRPLVNWRLRSRLPWEAQKNITPPARQWTEAASASIEAMSGEALGFIRREKEAVFRLASGSADQVSRAEGALAELDHLLAVPGGDAHE